MLAGNTVQGVGPVLGARRPALPLGEPVLAVLVLHELGEQLDLVLAALRPALAPLAEGDGLGPLLDLDRVGQVLDLVLAALGPPLAPLHRATQAQLLLHHRRLLQLQCFLDDGLLVFAALRPPSPSMLVVVGRVLIVLLNLLRLPLSRPLRLIHLLILLVFLVLVLVRKVLIDVISALVLQGLDLLQNPVVVGEGHGDPAAVLLALDLEFGEREGVVYGDFAEGVEGGGGGGGVGELEEFGWISAPLPYLLWMLLASKMARSGPSPRTRYTIRLRRLDMLSILIFIFNFRLNC